MSKLTILIFILSMGLGCINTHPGNRDNTCLTKLDSIQVSYLGARLKQIEIKNEGYNSMEFAIPNIGELRAEIIEGFLVLTTDEFESKLPLSYTSPKVNWLLSAIDRVDLNNDKHLIVISMLSSPKIVNADIQFAVFTVEKQGINGAPVSLFNDAVKSIVTLEDGKLIFLKKQSREEEKLNETWLVEQSFSSLSIKNIKKVKTAKMGDIAYIDTCALKF